MEEYIKLGIAALLPVIASVLLYLLDKYTFFGKLDYKVRQFVFGVIFGLLAIVGTEWGIPINGAQMNCRDAAVLTAGLMFGAPAGIIAGTIGAVERWIAVAWGVGTFTRVACTVSTFIAGIYSAILRKYMFDNKKPGWLISFAIGVVMEVLHLTMVFITNMDTPIEAMAVVKACTFPLVIANAVSVLASAVIISLLSKEFKGIKPEHIRISQTIQGWLLLTVVLAFAVTSYFVYSLQTQIALNQADSTLTLTLDEISRDVNAALKEKDPNKALSSIVLNRHVGESGFVYIYKDGVHFNPPPGDLFIFEKSSNKLDENFETPDTLLERNVNGDRSLCRGTYADDGWYITAVLPYSEAMQMRNIALYVNSFMEILVFAVLFALIYMLIKKVVVNQIKKVNGSLAKITAGNLDEIVNVRSNEEFASLSDDINSTVSTLKKYIEEASARIDKELELAKNIQSSALPGIFPAFPKRKDFDIYACMDPAKEVGGDFYDFYITDNDTLHFLIADVSGKGVPAAMFMMRAKTELKRLTEAGLSICDVFTNGNTALCEGNDAGMFVTAWQGGIDLISGTVDFANAGHNPPLVRHSDGSFDFLKCRPGFILAGMEGVKYKTQQLQLQPGDILFLYTDGVTEASNSENELFGDKRLLETLNSAEYNDMSQLCDCVKRALEAFVGDAAQFDDITMLALRYIGTPPPPSIQIENAVIDDITRVTEFIDEQLEGIDCPMKTVIQLNVAIDELFSNIVKYGYPDSSGPVKVEFIYNEDSHTVYIKFTDEGIPYNPLTKEDPDVTLSADERTVGGLGIFMVKRTMDDIKYKYENEKNILTIKKVI